MSEQEPVSKGTIEKILALLPRYPTRRAVLLPALHLVQEEIGHIPVAAQKQVARALGLPAVWVRELVSFYPLFFEQPVGRHRIGVCVTLGCHVNGARQLCRHIREKYGVDGEPGTSADGRLGLIEMQCLGSCHTAPVVLVDGERHDGMDAASLDAILEGLS